MIISNDLTEYLGLEAGIFKEARALRDKAQYKICLVMNNIQEVLEKNIKKGDKVRVLRKSRKTPTEYTFDSLILSSGKDTRASMVLNTDCQRRVIPIVSDDGELFPGFSEVYVEGKNLLKLK